MLKTLDGRQLLQFNQPNVQWKDFRTIQPKSRGSPVEKRIRCVINSTLSLSSRFLLVNDKKLQKSNKLPFFHDGLVQIRHSYKWLTVSETYVQILDTHLKCCVTLMDLWDLSLWWSFMFPPKPKDDLRFFSDILWQSCPEMKAADLSWQPSIIQLIWTDGTFCDAHRPSQFWLLMTTSDTTLMEYTVFMVQIHRMHA